MKISYSRHQELFGAILAEACIGLALLTFTWIIISYSLYMGDNHIRTAMAARHAAWLRGEKGGDVSDKSKEPTAADIEGWFFYEKDLTQVSFSRGELPLETLMGGDRDKYGGKAGKGPYLAKVTYGIQPDDLSSTTTFPFTLLKTHVPFMPSSLMGNVLSVSSTCQWDEVGNPWKTWAEALSGLWDQLKKIISGIL